MNDKLYTTITEQLGITVKQLTCKYGSAAVRRDAEQFARAWFAGASDVWKGRLTPMQLADMSVRLDYYRKPARKFDFPSTVQVINGKDLALAYYAIPGKKDFPTYASIARVFDLLEQYLNILPITLQGLEHLWIDQWAEIPRDWARDEYNYTANGAKFLREYAQVAYCDCNFAKSGTTGLFHYLAAWQNIFSTIAIIASFQPHRLLRVARKLKCQELSDSWKGFFLEVESSMSHENWDMEIARLAGSALSDWYAAVGMTLSGMCCYKSDSTDCTDAAIDRMIDYAIVLRAADDADSEWFWTTNELVYPVSLDAAYAERKYGERLAHDVFECAQVRAARALRGSRSVTVRSRVYISAEHN